jgi:hypothetical protein
MAVADFQCYQCYCWQAFLLHWKFFDDVLVLSSLNEELKKLQDHSLLKIPSCLLSKK